MTMPNLHLIFQQYVTVMYEGVAFTSIITGMFYGLLFFLNTIVHLTDV